MTDTDTSTSTPRTFVVGDVHGMDIELRALVAELSLTKDDTLVFVGDLVDKGPASAEVVRYCRELRDEGYDLVLVLGNHEAKHELFRPAYAKGKGKGMKGYDELATITDGLSEEDVAFLESGVLFHRLPEFDAVVVHAGFPSTIKELPESAEGLTQKNAGRLSQVLRTRFVRGEAKSTVTVEFSVGFDASDVTAETVSELVGKGEAKIVRSNVRTVGSFLKLGANKPSDPFWAELYDGRFGHTYFGHNPYTDATEPLAFPHATALDLGAVFGGRLAAVVLEVGQEPRFVSVPAVERDGWDFATALYEE